MRYSWYEIFSSLDQLTNELSSTVCYSFLFNGLSLSSFTLSRGIRQGDPLSSYLFIICVEGFSHLLRRAKNRRAITGVGVCRGAPKISHPFFVL